MDVSSPTSLSPDAVAAQAETGLLKRELDGARTQAAQLLDVLPPPPSLEPGKGTLLDTYA